MLVPDPDRLSRDVFSFLQPLLPSPALGLPAGNQTSLRAGSSRERTPCELLPVSAPPWPPESPGCGRVDPSLSQPLPGEVERAP